MKDKESKNEIIIYQGDGGQPLIEVKIQGETVWLTQDQMAELFGKGRSTITEHIQNIFKEEELDEKVVCRDFRLTTMHGAVKGKTQEISVKHYNLVSAFFDLAEVKAMEHEPMYMRDWISQLDKLIGVFDKKVLIKAGSVSHDEAIKKAEEEYKKYQAQTVSEVEKVYLDMIKTVQKKVEKKVKDQKLKRKKQL